MIDRTSETEILQTIRAALVRTGRVVLWRNNTGQDTTTHVKYGIGLGGADLVGILKPTGRFIAIEVKTKYGKQSKNQRLWQGAVERAGGVYIVARSVDEAFEQLWRVP